MIVIFVLVSTEEGVTPWVSLRVSSARPGVEGGDAGGGDLTDQTPELAELFIKAIQVAILALSESEDGVDTVLEPFLACASWPSKQLDPPVLVHDGF